MCVTVTSCKDNIKCQCFMDEMDTAQTTSNLSKNIKKPIKRINFYIDGIVFCFLYIAHYIYTMDLPFKKRLFLGLLSVSSVPGILIILKMIYLLREILFWRRVYDSWTNILVKCVLMRQWYSFAFLTLLNIGSLIYSICYYPDVRMFGDIIFQENITFAEFIMCPLLMISIGIYFKWYDSSLMESYKLEQSVLYRGGSNMACGFFYGYLKNILPEFVEKLNGFLARNKLSEDMMPFKKLFILVPSSSFIFDQLHESESLELLEERLDVHYQDRGLVDKRSFKNTVYKLKNKSKTRVECYVPLEGASPLKTFQETCQHLPQYKEHKREIVSSFYYTLENLISQDQETKDLVELIYFDDEKELKTDIAEVVRKRVMYLKSLP